MMRIYQQTGAAPEGMSAGAPEAPSDNRAGDAGVDDLD